MAIGTRSGGGRKMAIGRSSGGNRAAIGRPPDGNRPMAIR